MRLISAHELKEKLDRGDPLKLVNALGEWEYRTAHIPGSLHYGAYDIAALSAAVRGAGARANWRRDGGALHGSLQPG
jgi:hypothetical protein